MSQISIIVAVDKNWLIGKGSDLPWNFKEDLLYFKEKTMGKFVVMGENTYKAIPTNLKGRKMIVLSKEKNLSFKNATTVNSIKEALSVTDGEVMIAGGRSVYEQFLKMADRIYLTVINKEFEGDVYFPEFNKDEWKTVKEKRGEDPVLVFKILEKKTNSY